MKGFEPESPPTSRRKSATLGARQAGPRPEGRWRGPPSLIGRIPPPPPEFLTQPIGCAPAARPAATEGGKLRQVRKEAAVAAHLRVPAILLAAGGHPMEAWPGGQART